MDVENNCKYCRDFKDFPKENDAQMRKITGHHPNCREFQSAAVKMLIVYRDALATCKHNVKEKIVK